MNISDSESSQLPQNYKRLSPINQFQYEAWDDTWLIDDNFIFQKEIQYENY